MAGEKTTFVLSDSVYKFFKQLAMLWLPALGTAYFALAGIWDLPSAEQVVGTIVVVDTFLGTVLHLSTKSYEASDASHDGTMYAVPTEQGTAFHFNIDPQDLVNKDKLTFKVQSPPGTHEESAE